jgi:hypothetical protein
VDRRHDEGRQDRQAQQMVGQRDAFDGPRQHKQAPAFRLHVAREDEKNSGDKRSGKRPRLGTCGLDPERWHGSEKQAPHHTPAYSVKGPATTYRAARDLRRCTDCGGDLAGPL